MAIQTNNQTSLKEDEEFLKINDPRLYELYLDVQARPEFYNKFFYGQSQPQLRANAYKRAIALLSGQYKSSKEAIPPERLTINLSYNGWIPNTEISEQELHCLLQTLMALDIKKSYISHRLVLQNIMFNVFTSRELIKVCVSIGMDLCITPEEPIRQKKRYKMPEFNDFLDCVENHCSYHNNSDWYPPWPDGQSRPWTVTAAIQLLGQNSLEYTNRLLEQLNIIEE